MLMIGCDFHTRFQQIAMVDITTGEMITRRLEHENGQARNFYAALPRPARVGIEATMATQWFQRMLSELGHELWVGDAAAIRATMVRKQKTDARDALHILDLLITDRFPRIWIPSRAERDVRQMLKHRYKLVRFRTSIMNQLHALAMGQGVYGPNANCGIYPQTSTTNVPRTSGWHQLRISVSADSLSFSIDGSEVFSTDGDYSFDTVDIFVSGPAFRPDTTAYFDDFSFTPLQ